uniref:Uncharacterized protein n=1 Tax=Glossina palpalis gambiensis TaxID=67801 RepID=A0A1B0BVN4_9MUSC
MVHENYPGSTLLVAPTFDVPVAPKALSSPPQHLPNCGKMSSTPLGFSTLKFSITVSNNPLIGMSVQPIKNLHLCDFFLYTCTSNLSVSLTGASNENKQHLPHFGPVGSTHWPSSRSHIDKKTLFLNEISQHRESTPEAHASLLGENVRGVFD